MPQDAEDDESGQKKKAGGEMGRSLDEVSNVIHDMLSEPTYSDGEGKDPLEPIREESETVPGQAGGVEIPDGVVRSILEPDDAGSRHDKRYAFDEFIDERILVSRDALGKREMKIKVLEVSDEKAPTVWKLGNRVKVNRILVAIKDLESQSVEEGEFDIESIERELAEKRHYTSTNRWVPASDIKNGYVAGSRHTSLISDAVALDYIVF